VEIKKLGAPANSRMRLNMWAVFTVIKCQTGNPATLGPARSQTTEWLAGRANKVYVNAEGRVAQ